MNVYEDARNLEDLFGRFEHALKRSGHLKNRSDAQADWRSFAEAAGKPFFEEIVSSGIADTLINDAPRKLMADGLNWKPDHPPSLTNVEELFLQGVCRVRNSYIHYEKFVSTGDQWERDATLVHEALAVLRLAESKGIVELPVGRLG